MTSSCYFKGFLLVLVLFGCSMPSLAQQPTLKLPLLNGDKKKVLQTTGGSFSHQANNTRYDIDLGTDNFGHEVIVAAQEGTAYVFNDKYPGEKRGFGNQVNIDHGPVDRNNPGGPRYFTVYAHLYTFLVSNGVFVRQGQPIAIEGTTGFSTGNHLHFGLHVGNPQDRVDVSSSIRAEHVISRDIANPDSPFIMMTTEQFQLNHTYESNNTVHSSCVNQNSWNFSAGSQCWSFGLKSGASTMGFNAPGAWIIGVFGDPHIESPPISIDASTFKSVEISMASLANNTVGQVFFTTESSPNFSEEKSKTFTVIKGGAYNTHLVDFRGKEEWKGKITRIRVDPVASGNGQAVGIQWIRITPNIIITPDPVGTVSVNATLNGQPWSGGVDYSVVGPGGVIIGLAVPSTTHDLPLGQYTLRHNSGGPESLIEITPAATQTLRTNTPLTFTMAFGARGGGEVTAPRILTEDAVRAVALESVTLLRDPFPLATANNLSSDQRARITLFAENLDVQEGDVVSAYAEDATGQTYLLAVEYAGKVPNFDWLTQVIIRLPDGLLETPNLGIRIGFNGRASNKVVFNIKAAPPQVSSINPNPVPTFNSDQNVQVSGSNFQPNSKVDVFNGSGTKIATLSGAQVLNVTPTSFTMVVNLGSTASSFGIEVVSPSGDRSARFAFSTTANNPVVSSINPASPPVVNDNQNVQVSGSNFQSNLTVDVFNSGGTKLGTLSGTQVLNPTPTSFTMVINLGSTKGSFGIEVVNPNGGRSSRFTFNTQTTNPTVGSVSPNPVPTFNADQSVQVGGSNFQTNLSVDVFNSSGAKVGTLSGAGQIQNVTSTSFTMVIFLGSSASSFGLEVVNPDGGRSARFTFSTSAPNPAVGSINPNPVPVVNGNQNVQVFGNNFQFNLTVDVFNSSGSKIGTLSGTQVLNVTPTSFTMVVNLGSTAGSFGIEVVNPSGGRSTRFNFSTQATNPTVNSISPNPVPTFNADQNVQVNGNNFQSNLTVDVFNSSGSKIATLSGSQILNVTATSFTMVVSLGSTASSFGIEVVNPNGGRSARFTFSTTAANPTVSSISPNPVPVFNGNQNVQVSGNNFQFNLTVDVFNSSGTKLGTLSGTQIRNVTRTSFTMVIHLGSAAGNFGIEVVNPNGGRSARFNFSTR